MKKRTVVLALALVAGLVVAAVPAVAQENDAAAARPRPERTWPPEWVGKTLEEFKSDVVTRAEARIAQLEATPRLDEEEKTQRIAAIEDMLAAVDTADANAEVAGLVISRVQLERQEIRADRQGTTPDYESHIAGDISRAERRLDRLTTVASWAEAAGEDVAAVNDSLVEADAALAGASGTGDVVARHDAVHIALAWMTEAAAGLDALR